MKFSPKTFLCDVAALACLFLSPSIINGQVSECPKLSISGPDTVMPYGNLLVSAKIDPEPPTAAVNWLIVKENFYTKAIEVEDFERRRELSIPVWNSNDNGSITIVSTASFPSGCKARTAHRILCDGESRIACDA